MYSSLFPHTNGFSSVNTNISKRQTHLIVYLCVLFHRDCSNRTLWTRWLINKILLFLTVLEAGQSQFKVPADSGAGESPLFDSCVLTWREGWGSSPGSFIRALISSWGLYPHDLIIFQRLYLLISHIGVRTSTYEFEGGGWTKHSVYSTMEFPFHAFYT